MAKANQDLLGRTYEYCIQRFAEVEGKKGGEYYTPRCIVETLFVNATDLGHMVDRTHRVISPEDIAKIAGAFESFRAGKFQPEPGFSASRTRRSSSA